MGYNCSLSSSGTGEFHPRSRGGRSSSSNCTNQSDFDIENDRPLYILSDDAADRCVLIDFMPHHRSWRWFNPTELKLAATSSIGELIGPLIILHACHAYTLFRPVRADTWYLRDSAAPMCVGAKRGNGEGRWRREVGGEQKKYEKKIWDSSETDSDSEEWDWMLFFEQLVGWMVERRRIGEVCTGESEQRCSKLS